MYINNEYSLTILIYDQVTNLDAVSLLVYFYWLMSTYIDLYWLRITSFIKQLQYIIMYLIFFLLTCNFF